MKLLIVESPNKKKTITQYLGPGWRVEASMGHVCDLPIKELGISVPEYKPQYELTERGEQTITRLREVAKNAESVWLAMDPDREGEAIAGHIARYLKTCVSNFHRVVFHEITEKAVQKAIAAPRKLNRDLFYAQQARRVIDRLVGYQVSPQLSQFTQQKLSAGRVQSIAIRLLVERERAIRAFKPTEHFGLRLHFTDPQLKWFANLDTRPFVTEEHPYLQDKHLLEQLANIKEVRVLSLDKKTSQRRAPPPFITTTLQKAGSLVLGLTAEETMRLAQTLFEKGFITYHRTDSPNLSEDAIIAIQAELKNLHFTKQIPKTPNRWKARKGAEEAHEAIRPSNPSVINTLLDLKTQKLYELIRIRALGSQMSAALIETSTLILVPSSNFTIQDIRPHFIAKGLKTLYPGWRLLVQEDLAEEKLDEGSLQAALPDLQINTPLSPDQTEILSLKTQAPKRYTEVALISKLEKEEIGRPSTYAAILSNIKKKGYVALKGKCFEPEPVAEVIYDALVGKFKFMEIDYTRSMESALDEIAEGKQEYIKVVTAADHELQESLKKLNITENIKLCPLCQSAMRKINGKYGVFWGCSRYQQGCKGVFNDHNTRSISEPVTPLLQTPQAHTQHKCPSCGNNLKRIKGRGKFFWGCEQYASGCKLTLDDIKGRPARFYPCPKCQKPLRSFKTKTRRFWRCSAYKENDCKEHFEDQQGKPLLTNLSPELSASD